MKNGPHLLFALLIGSLTSLPGFSQNNASNQSDSPALHPNAMINPVLQISEKNPRYWDFNGITTPLLGGSSEDNLFQQKEVIPELELIASAGGNVIRNTMSDRDEGDLRAFKEVEPGRYDLSQWNPAYWERLDILLRETARLNIAVQIEVWDRFDHSRKEWQSDPWNPANNINYSYLDSGFAKEYTAHPAANLQPFFKTVPDMENNAVVLPYQQAFVRKLLQHTLPYQHVLYCMDNETSADPAWGSYWAEFIREESTKAGIKIYLTEMWDKWEVTSDVHRETTDHPERYDFVDISQNTQIIGQENWDNAQVIWQRLSEQPRPINSTKIYGNDTHPPAAENGKGTHHAITTFWRNLLGGFATSRFHRPGHGLGINHTAQYQIRSARLFLADYPIIESQPDSKLEALTDREENEAYLNFIPGQQAALLFPTTGSVTLNRAGELNLADHSLKLRWLNLSPEQGGRSPSFSSEITLAAEAQTALSTPEGSGPWLGVLSK